MDITLATWLAIPAVGGVIGYATNHLAVKMLFRPVKPVNILGLKIQGLMPRRQADMARSIGDVVGNHLVSHKDLANSLREFDMGALLGEMLTVGLEPKIQELRNLPLIGGFLTDERVEDLRKSIIESLLQQKEAILAKIEDAMEEGLDVRTVVAEKVASFPIEKLESLVLQVASRELRAIEILGGVLGVIIGLGQVGLLWLTA